MIMLKSSEKIEAGVKASQTTAQQAESFEIITGTAMPSRAVRLRALVPKVEG
jgi:hypothetical protein